jgi:hypothetical protein
VTREKASNRRRDKEPLWRWLAISVGGATSPFAILALVWLLVVSRHTSVPLQHTLSRGELFIPASVMNIEAVLTLTHLRRESCRAWQPPVMSICALAALGGAICFGVTAALTEAPSSSLSVSVSTLRRLSSIVTSMSFWEFIEAFTIGTIAVMLLVRSKRGGAA